MRNNFCQHQLNPTVHLGVIRPDWQGMTTHQSFNFYLEKKYKLKIQKLGYLAASKVLRFLFCPAVFSHIVVPNARTTLE